MKIESSQAVVMVSTNITRGCPYFCGKSQTVGGQDNFEDGIEHLIREHGCVLIHVGTDTTHDMNGGAWHSTVAVLASPVPLPEPPPFKIQIIPVSAGQQD